MFGEGGLMITGDTLEEVRGLHQEFKKEKVSTRISSLKDVAHWTWGQRCWSGQSGAGPGKAATKELDGQGMEIGLEEARMTQKRRFFFEFQMEVLGPHHMLHEETAKCLIGGPEGQLGSCWSGSESGMKEEMAAHSSILAWRIPWTEEPGGLQSMGSQRVSHDWATEHNITGLKIWPRKGRRTWEPGKQRQSRHRPRRTWPLMRRRESRQHPGDAWRPAGPSCRNGEMAMDSPRGLLVFLRQWCREVQGKIKMHVWSHEGQSELKDGGYQLKNGFYRQNGYWALYCRNIVLSMLSANIRRIIKKAREFQKNIYFCFIDYAKSFNCVDRNKLENSERYTRPPDLPL